jgi:hypothetical protein
MKIWHLARTGSVGYDEADGFVIVTTGEAEARDIAASQAGGEGCNVWYLSDVKAQVVGEAAEGVPAGIVLRSFCAG